MNLAECSIALILPQALNCRIEVGVFILVRIGEFCCLRCHLRAVGPDGSVQR